MFLYYTALSFQVYSDYGVCYVYCISRCLCIHRAHETERHSRQVVTNKFIPNLYMWQKSNVNKMCTRTRCLPWTYWIKGYTRLHTEQCDYFSPTAIYSSIRSTYVSLDVTMVVWTCVYPLSCSLSFFSLSLRICYMDREFLLQFFVSAFYYTFNFFFIVFFLSLL